jgi:RNA polymerase sigma factor (sigma-70 family)
LGSVWGIMTSHKSHINYLYNKALNNDKKAVNELFDYLSVSFRLFLQSRNLDRYDIEDIIQTVMLTISQKYRDLTSPYNFSSWAYKVLMNKLYDYYKSRKGKKSKNINIDYMAKEHPGINSHAALLIQLKKCLSKISKKNLRYMRVLNLSYFGYTKSEICRKLQITPGNFYVILSRARAMLKRCLEEGDII